jgi:hypothetical protein
MLEPLFSALDHNDKIKLTVDNLYDDRRLVARRACKSMSARRPADTYKGTMSTGTRHYDIYASMERS